MIQPRKFRCGLCQRTLHQNFPAGYVFEGHMPLGEAQVRECPSCLAWYAQGQPTKEPA
jgi:hypothetical protein